MEKNKSEQNRRRVFNFNPADRAQQYFIFLEFILMSFTVIYLMYLIFSTIDKAANQVSIAGWEGWSVFFEHVNFLLLVRISILFAIVFVIHVMLGLFFLHRLIGPMDRTRRIFSDIADGRVPESNVMLRKDDFPTEFAHELSRALDKIRSWRDKNPK